MIVNQIKNEDLVLKVSAHINPEVWDESKYDAFVDELCGDREYQKEAIFTALRFLAGGKYENLHDLAKENFKQNPKLEEAYGSWEAMKDGLQFPNLLACSLDLATGTGKSYVLYGIATILLAEDLVDHVLTLCPSNTIERGLTDKFRDFARNADLLSAMPTDVKYASPRIINASETIVEGCICVENYHAVLKHVKSSIRDSLRGKGERTLILNDETHHVVSSPSDLRKWKEFLIDGDFAFWRIVGVSGTCYTKNQYFTDVISRYSLRQAIEERRVKDVEYIAEATTVRDPDEKWQLIYQGHKTSMPQLLKRQGIRPLTIIVTDKINACNDVADELRCFLKGKEGISSEQANQKVIAVTSSSTHQLNVARLKTVDSPQSNVEWIISVSMLTEGWDVKNVFQIVPHEKRAFNSKLLIAQVLGRGLRVPEQWQGVHPVVTIFNHASWVASIKDLVNEILEIEKRVSSVSLPKSEYHFKLHNLNYDRTQSSADAKKTGEYNLLTRGYIDLPSLSPVKQAQIQFDRVGNKSSREEIFQIHVKTFTASEIAKHMHDSLASFDLETSSERDPDKRTNYATRYPLGRLEKAVKESAQRAQIDEKKIPEEARQKFLQALGTMKRKISKRVAYATSAKELVEVSTKERQKDSCSAVELSRDKSIFYRSDCEQYLPREQKDFFHELTDIDGDYAGSVVNVDNDYNFKTPFNLAIADSNPERKFIRELCKPENARKVDGWMKNTAMGFYAVDYAWSKPTARKGGGAPHVKRGKFSPDFFIKQDKQIFVVEIKDDDEINEPSRENIAKYEFSVNHFRRLNGWLDDGPTYQFNMLTPDDYLDFFDKLCKDELQGYRSHLDAAILQEISAEDAEDSEFEELDVVKLTTNSYKKDGLKEGEVGTIVLVHKREGNSAYEIEFAGWMKHYPIKVKTLQSNDIEIVKKWRG